MSLNFATGSKECRVRRQSDAGNAQVQRPKTTALFPQDAKPVLSILIEHQHVHPREPPQQRIQLDVGAKDVRVVTCPLQVSQPALDLFLKGHDGRGNVVRR